MMCSKLFFSTQFSFLFLLFNPLFGQIEIEQDSTVSIGTKFATNAYLKVQAINKNTGMYLRNIYSPDVVSTKYGLINKLTVGTTDEYRGILIDVKTVGITPNKKLGLLNDIEGLTTVNSIGTYNWVRNYGTTAYGTLNKIEDSSSPGNLSVGTYNISTSDDNTFKYGMQNYLLGSAATAYGLNNIVNTASVNHSFGIFNVVYQYNSNIIYGTRSNIITSTTGTKPAYGTFNYIFDKNNQAVYGNYNLIIPESTVTGGTKYGSFNEIKSGGNPSEVYGVYADINNQPGFAGYFDGPLFTTDNTLTRSDARFKKNIRPQENNLDKVLKLQPRNYNLKNAPDSQVGHLQVGFIAQEVQKILPDLVYEITPPTKEESIVKHPATSLTDQEDNLSAVSASYLKNDIQEPIVPFLALQYDGFIPIIVGAIQEQQAEINSTRNLHLIVKEYEQRIVTLEEQLEDTRKALSENTKIMNELKGLIYSIDK